jgi:hypothetical protein
MRRRSVQQVRARQARLWVAREALVRTGVTVTTAGRRRGASGELSARLDSSQSRRQKARPAMTKASVTPRGAAAFTRKHASGRADAGAPVRGKGSVRRRGSTTPRGRKRSRGLTASALFEAGRLAQLVGPRVPQTAPSDTLGYGEQRPPLLVRGATRARPAGHARRSGWWRWTARARVAMLASGLGSASIGRCVGVAARWAWR